MESAPGFKTEAGSQLDIREIAGLLCIEWNIKNYKSLLRVKPSERVSSPVFQMGHVYCKFSLRCCGRAVYLFLCKLPHQKRKHHPITCQITLEINGGEICGGYRRTVDRESRRAIGAFVNQEELIKHMTSDDLTVMCTVYPEVERTLEAVSEDFVKVETRSLNTYNEGIDILASHVKDLFLKGEDCDFVIKVKDREFQVHKAILCSRSPVLSAMLHHDMAEKRSGTTEIEDCEPDIFERFLLYLYSGQVGELSWENATHLYTLGDKYDMPHLGKQCLQFMKGNLTIEVFCDAIRLAVKHDESSLVECAKAFFLENAEPIVVSNKWQFLMKENPVICNELFIKHITTKI